ncbi:hypothetical protein ACWEK5_43210 [Rhodococcus koreensis]
MNWHEDDERDAWTMRQAGTDWQRIGIEMGCTATTAQSLAAAYERRTDERAAREQMELF